MRALYPPLQPSLLPLPRNPLRSYAAQTCSWACYEYEYAINISQTRRRPSDACRFHPTRLLRCEWDAGRTSSCLSAAPSQTRAPRSRKRINVNIALIPPNASNCVPALYLKCDVAVRSVCQEGGVVRRGCVLMLSEARLNSLPDLRKVKLCFAAPCRHVMLSRMDS